MGGRDTRHAAAAGIVLVLGLALLVSDFALVSSRAEVEFTAGYSGDTQSAAKGRDIQLFIGPEVDGRIRLEAEILKALQLSGVATGSFAATRSTDDPAELEPGRPVFAVYGLETRTVWTPIYATCRATLQYGFAAEPALLPPPPPDPLLGSSDGFVLRGEIKLTHRAWGLITWPAYRRLVYEALAEQAARELARDLTGSGQ